MSNHFEEYYYRNGKIKSIQYPDGKGKYHRKDGPAYVEYHLNGNIAKEVWMVNGLYHREDGPARIEYYVNGHMCIAEWYVDGIIHRPNAPARCEYHDDKGQIWIEHYYVDKKRHREDGPALIFYDRNGDVTRKHYLWWDKEITYQVTRLFGNIPDKLTKEQCVLLKLSLPIGMCV